MRAKLPWSVVVAVGLVGVLSALQVKRGRSASDCTSRKTCGKERRWRRVGGSNQAGEDQALRQGDHQ